MSNVKEDLLDKPLPLAKVVVGGFVLLTTAVTATYVLTDRTNEGEVKELAAQLEGERRKGAPPSTEESPGKTANPPASGAQPKDTQELSAKIAKLEEEKQALVNQLGELSRDALSPERANWAGCCSS